MRKILALFLAVVMLCSFAACGNNNGFRSGGGGGGSPTRPGDRIGNIYENGHMRFLGKHKDQVLPELITYEHYGEFEGADMYTSANGTFAFEFGTGICVNVNGNFVDVMPGFSRVALNGVVSKATFDRYSGLITELHTTSETAILDVPSLTATHGEYLFVIKCDASGNISLDGRCQVYLKKDAPPPPPEDNTVIKNMYVVNCTDCVNLRRGPSVNEEIITSAPFGAEVGYISSGSNGFFKVNYKGHIGYMHSDYLSDTKPQTNPTSPDGSYKAAFAQVLNGVLGSGEYLSGAKFELVYIDSDNIPELVFYTQSINASGARIYKYSNGTAVQIKSYEIGETSEFGSFGCIHFKEKSNMFVGMHINGGYIVHQIYRINGTAATHLAEFKNASGVNQNQPDYGKYYIDGIEVSYGDYIAVLNSYNITDEALNDFKIAPSTGAYALTASNIRSVLQ